MAAALALTAALGAVGDLGFSVYCDDYGGVVYYRRRELKMSQRSLGKLTGYGPVSAEHHESECRFFERRHEVEKVAEVLGLRADLLLEIFDRASANRADMKAQQQVRTADAVIAH